MLYHDFREWALDNGYEFPTTELGFRKAVSAYCETFELGKDKEEYLLNSQGFEL